MVLCQFVLCMYHGVSGDQRRNGRLTAKGRRNACNVSLRILTDWPTDLCHGIILDVAGTSAACHHTVHRVATQLD